MTSSCLLRRALCVSILALLGCSDDSTEPTSSGGSGGAGGAGGAGGSGGAGAAGGSGGEGGSLAESCPVTHAATTSDGHEVVVCEELFAEAPFIRPPADEAPFAFGATDGAMLFLRDAEPRLLTTEESTLMGLGVEDDSEAKRFGYAIYRFELDDAGAVIASAPALLIEDAAFLSFLTDVTLEGFISRREDDPMTPNDFEDPPTLPVRLRFATSSTASQNSDPTLDVISTSELGLVVENLTDSVLGSNGSCFTPITDAGADSPFDGAEPALKGLRVPSMHGPGDNEFVIDGATLVNHMTPGWIVLPHHLLVGDSFTFDDAEFMPHGNPLSMPRLSLSLVAAGGGACP